MLTLINDAAVETTPSHFTYPYYYQPHPLAIRAMDSLKTLLPELETGHMFAVLVVKDKSGRLGYLSGFSGAALSTPCSEIQFVPRLVSELALQQIDNEFESQLEALQEQIKRIQTSAEFAEASQQLAKLQAQAEKEIKAQQAEIVAARKHRKQLRNEADQRGDFQFVHELNQQSVEQKIALQKLKQQWQNKLRLAESNKQLFVNKINLLKSNCDKLDEERRQRLNKVFTCLNAAGESKDLTQFELAEHVKGVGDEAIVKCLQYAFDNGVSPLAYAQFWWGPSPEKAVRHHGRAYAVSRTKCAEVLKHMLSGVSVQTDPFIERLSKQQQCDIVYRDEALVVINKPADLLSVPGADIEHSVYSQMQGLFPRATGPMIVHRLDMSTSGLMVVALNAKVHKHLQQQFIRRSVEKRYVAMLDGVSSIDSGTICLPLRPDLEDRPRQVVCEEYGRYAETAWQVIERNQMQTRVYFYPKTGRSHQLRMHAAHQQGLNMPIVGDDLYSKVISDTRLHLHAESLSFVHPVTNQTIHFQCDPDF